MKQALTVFLIFMFMGEIFAQNNYAVALIPDSLKNNSQAVVREQKEFLLQKDERNGIYKCSKVITIFNAKGLSKANFVVGTDDFDELKNFSGEIFDAHGKSVKKIKQKDLQTLQLTASYELITNAKTIYYEYFNPRFPFTIKYEWELKLKDGILYFPSFAPIPGFDVAVQYAEYTVQVPDEQIVRYKNSSTDIVPAINGNRYFWKIENLKAIEYEGFVPAHTVFPVVYIAPENFCVQDACGNMKTWENYGNWLRELQKGRDILPENTKKKVKELTQNITDKREKVKILYDFMQKTTHYVSIQLGVGGWQPIPASEVARTGFGDCKALSNYMKALLAVVEIPSFYTPISTVHKHFFSDFPSFGQTNHIILTVPIEQDTIYLECTSQLAPFGYIGDLAGHDCLLVGDKTVSFHNIPAYLPKENATFNNTKITVFKNGTANLQVHTILKNEDCEKMYYTLKTTDEKGKNDALAGLLNITKPQISNFNKQEQLNERPELDLSFDVVCENFASLTNSRILFKINPFRLTCRNILTGNKRIFDIAIPAEHFQKDSIVVDIPDGYMLEMKANTTEINSNYGSLKIETSITDTQVLYVQTLEIKKGVYSAAEFEDMKKFFLRLDNLQNSDIVFRKKE